MEDVIIITNPMIAVNESAKVTLSKFLRVIEPCTWWESAHRGRFETGTASFSSDKTQSKQNETIIRSGVAST